MANNYLVFSEVVPQLTAEEEAWLRQQLQLVAVQDGQEVEIDDVDDAPQSAQWSGPRFLRDNAGLNSACDVRGFQFEFHDDHEPEGWGRHLWLYAEEYGEPGIVAWLMQKFLKRFRPSQFWSLTYATSCSKPRVGEFGGGTVFVTADEIQCQDAHDFAQDCTQSFQRRTDVARLIEKAEGLGIASEDLDEAVHDTASVPASATNNGGLGEQIAYLVEQLGAEETEKVLERAVP